MIIQVKSDSIDNAIKVELVLLCVLNAIELLLEVGLYVVLLRVIWLFSKYMSHIKDKENA